MERDFPVSSALDSCLRRDVAGATPFRELPVISAISRLRLRWPSRRNDLDLHPESNAAKSAGAH
jgi:hypothetical protein